MYGKNFINRITNKQVTQRLTVHAYCARSPSHRVRGLALWNTVCITVPGPFTYNTWVQMKHARTPDCPSTILQGKDGEKE